MAERKELTHMNFRCEEEHILSFFGAVYEKASILRCVVLDAKLPQQAGNVVSIYDVIFLSEIWQELTVAFFIEGYESFTLKQIFSLSLKARSSEDFFERLRSLVRSLSSF